MTARSKLVSIGRDIAAAASLFIKDIGHGLLVVSHNTLALLGLALVSVLLVFFSQDGLRHRLESQTLGWLSARQEARGELLGNILPEPDAVARATAFNPRELPRSQAAVAMWLSRRYKVAPEPVSRLVQEAWIQGRRAQVEPTLILAVMAVESGFNPFAQSSVGAQGLMQVLTRVHDDKYEAFGGNFAAFDPISNLRVGVQVLKECIQRAGSVEEGLRFYVGAAKLPDDAGYAARVLSEHEQLKAVASGMPVQARVTREVALSTPAPSEGNQVALLR